MGNDVIVFTLLGCGHCESLKKRLITQNIFFNEIEITQNPDIWSQVVEQTGYNLLPTVFIRNEGSEDGTVFVPGRDYQSEDDIINLINEYILKKED